jgi:hypothetical protein
MTETLLSLEDEMDKPETEKEGFVIDTPELANWAIRKVKEARQRRDLFTAAAQSQIEQLEEKIHDNEIRCDQETAFLMSALSEYIDKVPAKATKTQKTFLLPEGKMKKKFSAQVMKVQEDTLIQYLAGEEEYIKVVKKPAWSEFKKLLTIIDDKVIRTDTGEIVDGVTVETKPEIFDIE